jgi:amphi-Trp domain-containing protein
MDIFEVEQKERLTREEVAARLRNLADMLARHNDIEFERGGMKFTVKVPDELNVKVESKSRATSASWRSSSPGDPHPPGDTGLDARRIHVVQAHHP